MPQGPHGRGREARGRARGGEQGAARGGGGRGRGRGARGGVAGGVEVALAVAGSGRKSAGSGRVLLRHAAGPSADRRSDRTALERARVAVEDEAEGLEDSGGLAAEEPDFFFDFFFFSEVRKPRKKEKEKKHLLSFSLSLFFFETHPPASATAAGARWRLSAERAAQRLLRTSPVVEGEAAIFFSVSFFVIFFLAF